ncbi:MAG: DUF459 domain-containing protein [Hyphomicrobiales bacterium]
MTKTYTHSAMYFASVVFLSVSIGAISHSYAESTLGSETIISPVLKKKTPKLIVEEVVELEAKPKRKKTSVVRRRKDPVVLPRVRPDLNENGGVFELAQLGPHAELPAENASNEASSTVDLDSVTTSSVILDQDQPQDANVSAAAGSESAANADELALLKAEIASLKAQLLSEKENAAKLTGDLVRAKEKTLEQATAKQAAAAKKSDVAEDAAEKTAEIKAAEDVVAEPNEPKEAEVSDVKTPALNEVVGNDAAKRVDATKEAVATPKTAADTVADAETLSKDASEKAAAETEAKTNAATQAADKAEEKGVDAKKVADDDTASKVEEPKVALAPADPAKSKSDDASKAVADPNAANASLKEGEEAAEIDPALLLPFPRENPFERVIPKVAKGPLYIKLPPINDTYNIYVLGDSLGSGLWQGLHQNFRGSVAPAIKVVKKAKANTGIVRSDRFDWMENMEKIANGGGFQLAVLMFGANDAQSIRAKGKRHHFRTPGWEQLYRARIDRMIRALKRKKIAVYWVGLPNVRVASLREDYLHFNAIFKEKADEHGIHFIETWDVTNDENGEWQPSGKTVQGRKAVLRAKDGTHFTSSGYRRLAQFPEEILRPDINQARANRLAKGLRIRGNDG